jgi:hypothetical protein
MNLYAVMVLLLCTTQCFAASFTLADPGTEDIIDYTKYGRMTGVGTPKYKYEVTDWQGLKKAAGEGIYPNEQSVLDDQGYQDYLGQGKLDGSSWSFLSSTDTRAEFYKWAAISDDPGIKLLYTAEALAKSGLYHQALKAYYAIVVHFPKCWCWNEERTFIWYVGPVAIAKINRICRAHHELGINLVDARIEVDSRGDNNIAHDVITVNPGNFVPWTETDWARYKVDVSSMPVIKRIGSPEHQLVQLPNGYWQFRVNGKPFIIQGMSYGTTKVGQSPQDGTLKDWMLYDYNKNGKIDGPYDSFVDKNRNNQQDPDEPAMGDWQLLKDMGCNTLRIYHHASNRQLLRDLYRNYGISVLMGDFLGVYAQGSGASWAEGTDYGSQKQRDAMLASVKKMVLENKDEPYVLLWVLGNENNYGSANNYRKDPERYFAFANQAARLIKELDPTRPVAISNGDVGDIKLFARNCPDIDIFGVNAYRGSEGFGDMMDMVKETTGKPCLVLEFGCPAYHSKGLELGEEEQARYLLNDWQDIMDNTAGNFAGNALGGVIFEWMDDWWKCGDDVKNGIKYDPAKHDTVKLGAGPFPDGWGYSEWFGIVGQGDGSQSPYLRQLRKAYFRIAEAWNKTR